MIISDFLNVILFLNLISFDTYNFFLYQRMAGRFYDGESKKKKVTRVIPNVLVFGKYKVIH